MKSIEIDEEIFSYLQGQAIPYIESPNDTIRRLLGLDKAEVPPAVMFLPQKRPHKVKGRKKPKADLFKLTNAGYLKEGQLLHARDYQQRKLPNSEAAIHQGGLLKDRESYSMSDLAEKLLKTDGYLSNSVRGPAHWFTENGDSIRKLWEDYLKKNGCNYNS